MWAASLMMCWLLWQPVTLSIYYIRFIVILYFVYCTLTKILLID